MMKKSKTQLPIFLLLTLVGQLLVLSAAGCQDSKDAQDAKAQQETGSRITTIVTQSEGDWNKVSAADQKYLITDLSGGDVQSARMLFDAKAGKLRVTRRPSGPPRVAPH